MEHKVKKRWKRLRSDGFDSMKEGLQRPGGLANLGAGLASVASHVPKPGMHRSESKEETLEMDEMENGKGKGKGKEE